jgi:predicted GNAT superfamily acetyltransferase
VAVLAHAATVPEQRGRGHLRALVAAQLAAAAAAGARLAVARLAVARGEPALAALRASLAQGLRLAYHEAHWRRDGAARG